MALQQAAMPGLSFVVGAPQLVTGRAGVVRNIDTTAMQASAIGQHGSQSSATGAQFAGNNGAGIAAATAVALLSQKKRRGQKYAHQQARLRAQRNISSAKGTDYPATIAELLLGRVPAAPRTNGATPKVNGRTSDDPKAASGIYCEAVQKCVRRKTCTVTIGKVKVGSDHPIATQTMTTTLTEDVEATVAQIKRCADMGVDIVRVTVQGMKQAKACEHIRRRLDEDGYDTPIVADITSHLKWPSNVLSLLTRSE